MNVLFFGDQFAVGLHMPCQDFIKEILKAYHIEMHHLIPNLASEKG
jgi:hypothetical protein